VLLKSVELFGFKSFPERTRMDFEKGITVSVGPNGCGKSNISDAVRWVFGEHSTHALRGKKMEDVIFNGTTDRSQAGYAEVSLAFDNSDRALGIDSDEAVITRRLYRSGESEYLINKKQVRLKDIAETLMDTGMGLDGYSLIGQGKISEIISAKNDERREIFEEAAGIAKHRYRREEAERSLAKAGDNLVRLTDILNELESRVGPLAEQAEKAKKYIGFSARKRELELAIWTKNAEKAGESVEDMRRKTDMVKAQLSDCAIRLADCEEETEKLFSATQSVNAAIDEKRRAVEGWRENAAAARGEAELLRGEQRHRTSDVERIRGQIAELTGLLLNGDEQNAQRQNQLAAKSAEAETISAEAGRIAQQIATLEAEAGTLEKDFLMLTKALEEAAARLADLRVSKAQTATEAEGLKQRIAEDKIEIEHKKAARQEITEEIELLGADLAESGEALLRRKNAQEGLSIKLTRTKERLAAAEAEISRLHIESEQKRHKAQTLEDMEKQMEGFAHSVKAVLAQAARGGLKGIRGPVYKLMEVPATYTVAIETALGGALQNIVTETEEQAKYAIGYLKQENQGRATFLPVSTIKGEIINGKQFEKYQGFIGVAADLIQYSKEYTGIFGSLLGRILICEDLDSATALAGATGYRWRAVTLDGQVINAGGSLTGGSLAKGTGILSRQTEINALRGDCAKIEGQLKEKRAALELEKKEAEAAENTLRENERATAGLSEEKMRIELAYGQQKKMLEDNITAVADAEAAAMDMERRITAAAVMIEEIDRQTAATELLLSEKTAETQRLTVGRSEFFTRRDALMNSLSETKIRLLACQKDMEAISALLTNSQTDKDEKQSRIAALEVEIQALEEANLQDDEKIAATGLAAQELSGQAEEAEQSIQDELNRRSDLEAAATHLREREKEINNQNQLLSAELARLEERGEAARTEYDGLVAKLWDEYGLTRQEAAGEAAQIDDFKEAGRELNKIKDEIKKLGSVNVSAADEYKEVYERYSTLKGQMEDIERSRSELGKLISDINQTMTEMFMKSYESINSHFKVIFSELFGGGHAELLLDDPQHILESGITIDAHPPGKRVNSLESLSGGEQALLAISIYFAILKVRPSPFCLLDEIEAALDEVNIRRFTAYLHRMTGSTQFIVISHRRGTMEAANLIYGVTMQHKGVSKLLELKIQEVEQKIGIIAG